MLDPSLDIRTAFYTAITAALSTDFVAVQVFDNILLATDVTPRVILHTQTYSEGLTKDSFGGEASIDVDIIDAYPIGTGGSKRLDQIANTILQSLTPTKGSLTIDLGDNFKVAWFKIEIIPLGTTPQPQAKTYLLRKILRFKIFVQQLES